MEDEIMIGEADKFKEDLIRDNIGYDILSTHVEYEDTSVHTFS